MNERVKQIRTDSLVAEHIYANKLWWISLFSILINVLTIIVPILFSAVLLIGKGTSDENSLNIISIIVSAVLLSLVIFGLIIKVDQKRESYLIGRRSNIYVSNEALKLIDESDENLTWFYNYLVEMDSKDQENIGNVSENLRMKAYRYSLKKLFPGRNDIVCSICKASPFIYKKGSCQVCGNTPKE